MQFRPGILTPSQAAELNDMAAAVRRQSLAGGANQFGGLSSLDLNGVKQRVDLRPGEWLARITGGPNANGYYTAEEIVYGADTRPAAVTGGKTWNGVTDRLVSPGNACGPESVVKIVEAGTASTGVVIYVMFPAGCCDCGEPSGSGVDPGGGGGGGGSCLETRSYSQPMPDFSPGTDCECTDAWLVFNDPQSIYFRIAPSPGVRVQTGRFVCYQAFTDQTCVMSVLEVCDGGWAGDYVFLTGGLPTTYTILEGTGDEFEFTHDEFTANLYQLPANSFLGDCNTGDCLTEPDPPPGTVATDCCPSDEIPTTLTLTIFNAAGAMFTAMGGSYTLTYQANGGGNPTWSYTTAATGGTYPSVTIILSCISSEWYLYISYTWSGNKSATFTTSDGSIGAASEQDCATPEFSFNASRFDDPLYYRNGSAGLSITA